MEDSVGMVELALAGGTTEIVATPHCNDEYRYDESLVEGRIRELAAAAGGRLRIHRGCDFHLTFENVQDAVAHPTRYSIAGGPYLLVEFPNGNVHGFGPALERLLGSGLIPIITHPERHPALQKIDSDFVSWIEQGCVAQITGHSLMGRFGEAAQDSAWKMVDRGLAHFVASDAHGVKDRTPHLGSAFAAMVERSGRAVADRLFLENPQAVIHGEAVPRASLRRQPWYRFFR